MNKTYQHTSNEELAQLMEMIREDILNAQKKIDNVMLYTAIYPNGIARTSALGTLSNINSALENVTQLIDELRM